MEKIVNKKTLDAFQGHQRVISDMGSNPAKVLSKIGESLEGMSKVAPNTSGAMTKAAMNAVNYLYQVLPKKDSTSLLSDPYQPSDGDLASFQRKVAAVENPMSVLEDLKHGRLSADSVDALKSVYPNIHEQAKNEILKRIPGLDRELTSNEKQNLATFLQMPVKETMKPDQVQSLQSNFDQNDAQGSIRLPGADKMEKSERVQSGSEKVSNANE